MPGPAQLLGQRPAGGLGLRADRDDRDRPRLPAGATAAACASRSMPAAQPTPGTSGPPIVAHQPVVAAAGQHRALRAQGAWS